MSTTVTEEDAEIETAAVVIEHLLHQVTPDKRAAVLERALETEKAEQKEREKHNGLRVWSAAEMADMNTPGLRYWNDVMEFNARLVYVFTRNIVNNHSPKNAAKLLFTRQRAAAGSGYLEEYIDHLPRPAG
jgi:hypothetical protein